MGDGPPSNSVRRRPVVCRMVADNREAATHKRVRSRVSSYVSQPGSNSRPPACIAPGGVFRNANAGIDAQR